MVEQPHSGEGHGNTILVAGLDDVVVAYAAASLCHVLYAALVGTLDVVAKGEESIAAQANACVLGYPSGFLLACQRLRTLGEELLPSAVGQHVVVVVADIDIDGVVAVGAADARHEGQAHHFRVLA